MSEQPKLKTLPEFTAIAVAAAKGRGSDVLLHAGYASLMVVYASAEDFARSVASDTAAIAQALGEAGIPVKAINAGPYGRTPYPFRAVLDFDGVETIPDTNYGTRPASNQPTG